VFFQYTESLLLVDHGFRILNCINRLHNLNPDVSSAYHTGKSLFGRKDNAKTGRDSYSCMKKWHTPKIVFLPTLNRFEGKKPYFCQVFPVLTNGTIFVYICQPVIRR
jgi:hypothetical protein